MWKLRAFSRSRLASTPTTTFLGGPPGFGRVSWAQMTVTAENHALHCKQTHNTSSRPNTAPEL